MQLFAECLGTFSLLSSIFAVQACTSSSIIKDVILTVETHGTIHLKWGTNSKHANGSANCQLPILLVQNQHFYACKWEGECWQVGIILACRLPCIQAQAS